MQKIILVTLHRRESFGEPLQNICQALKQIAELFPDIDIIYPVHPNPNVRQVVYPALQGIDRIHLIEPLVYNEFVHLMQKAYLVLTDSGGIQEEAPALSKPVIVLRDKTERPLVVSTGVGQLIGTVTVDIVKCVCHLLSDTQHYQQMAKGQSPYGDGHAAKRTVDILQHVLGA